MVSLRVRMSEYLFESKKYMALYRKRDRKPARFPPHKKIKISVRSVRLRFMVFLVKIRIFKKISSLSMASSQSIMARLYQKSL